MKTLFGNGPICGPCTLGGAILVCLMALCWGSFLRSGRGRRCSGEARAAQFGCFCSRSSSVRCPLQHYEPSGDRGRGSASTSASAPDPLPHIRTSSHQEPFEAPATATKASIERLEFPRSGGRIKLTKAASSPPALLIVDERILAFCLSFLRCLCPVRLSPGLFPER